MRWVTRRVGMKGRIAGAIGVVLVTVGSIPALSQPARARRNPSRAPVSAPVGDTAAATSPIRAGWIVRPDTVTVGDPFTLVVSMEVPAEATVQWPTIGDTAAVVSMRAPTRVTSEARGATRRETAEYALAAWDVGVLPLGLPDATVRTPTGVRLVPLREARIAVRTVLPADTALRVPKPARGLFPRVVPWWEAWWPAAAFVAALALLWWLWYRRKHRVTMRPVTTLDVFARAIHDFERLQRLALVDLGERGRAVALSVEILRTYLSARIPGALLSGTSDELLAIVQADARVPSDRLASLLVSVDAIKFAHHMVSGVRAGELQVEARAIVEQVEGAEQARRKREAAAQAASERASREADRLSRQMADDEARRRVRRPKAGAT